MAGRYRPRLHGGNIAVDALSIVMECLNPLDLLMCAGVDRTWNIASGQEMLWKKIWDQRVGTFPSLPLMPELSIAATYKDRFLSTLDIFRTVRARQLRAQNTTGFFPTREDDMPERLIPLLVGLPTHSNSMMQALQNHPDSKAFLAPILTWQMHQVFRAYIIRSLVIYICVHILFTFVTTDCLALVMVVVAILAGLYRCYTFDVLPTIGDATIKYLNNFLSKLPPQIVQILQNVGLHFQQGITNANIAQNLRGTQLKIFNQMTWLPLIQNHIQHLTATFDVISLDDYTSAHIHSKSRMLCVLAHVCLLIEFQTLFAFSVFLFCLYNMFRNVYRIISTYCTHNEQPGVIEFLGSTYAPIRRAGLDFSPSSIYCELSVPLEEHDVCGNDLLGVLLQRYGGFHPVHTAEQTYISHCGLLRILCVNSLLPSCVLYTAKYIGVSAFLGWPFFLCCLYWFIVVIVRLHPITAKRQWGRIG
jgi:hypothetical protein